MISWTTGFLVSPPSSYSNSNLATFAQYFVYDVHSHKIYFESDPDVKLIETNSSNFNNNNYNNNANINKKIIQSIT